MKNLKEVLLKVEYTHEEIRKHIRGLEELKEVTVLPEEKKTLYARLVVTEEELRHNIEELKSFLIQILEENATLKKRVEFLESVEKFEVDIVLMDISMPGLDGIATTNLALAKQPDLKIIVLTMFSDEENYYKAIQTGASGYILKESGKDELDIALQAVISNETYFTNLSECKL